MKTTGYSQKITTPLGQMLAVGSSSALSLLEFIDAADQKRLDLSGLRSTQFSIIEEKVTPLFETLTEQLNEYFAGERTTFSIPLLASGTPFQQSVWNALQEIPYGQTWSYASLARHLGDLKAIRAVGRANGQNPIAILVPCHRVIGSDGKLIGYAGGLERKRHLLKLEGAQAPAPEGQKQLF